jgi:hypothetical protein
MPVDAFDSDEAPATYFGLYSPKQRAQLVELLDSLRIQFEFVATRESEGRFREWAAWDESSAQALEGYELFVLTSDLEKLGTKLVEMFPERTFGAL